MRQIIVTAAVTAAMVLTGVGTGSAISLGGVTAPIEKYEHLVETSKGKPCTCVVPPEITHASAPVVMGGFYRRNIALDEGYVTIPLGNGCVGATCYLIGFSVADATCDISVFQPYTAIKSWLYSCQNADAE